MNYYYAKTDNQPSEPVSRQRLDSLLASGEITRDTLVCPVGGDAWKTYHELFAHPTAAPAGTTTPVPVGPSTTNPLALSSMILGIATYPMSCLLGVFGVSTAIAAVVTGHMARAQIKHNPDPTSSNMALAGLILGYIYILLMAIAIAVMFAFFGAILMGGGSMEEIFSSIVEEMEQMDDARSAE